MTVQLWIGEVAKLLGVTTKTIRYYEDIGLLDEPLRTDAGYRVYDAQDLLRLYRIKQLQDLGLSLERVHLLLGEPERHAGDTHAASDILRALEGELTAQIAELEKRRSQIQELLAQSSVDPLKAVDELPPTLKLLQEYLGEGVELDMPATTYAGQLWSELDFFLWEHAEYQQQQRELIGYMAEYPQARSRIVELINRVAALGEGSPAAAHLSGAMSTQAPGIEQLVEEIIEEQAQNPILIKILSFGDRREESTVDILAQILTGGVEPSPQQKLLFQQVAQRLPRVN